MRGLEDKIMSGVNSADKHLNENVAPAFGGFLDKYIDLAMWPVNNPASFIGAGGVAATLPLWGSKVGNQFYNMAFSPNHFWSGKELPDYKIPAPNPINKVGAYLKALGKVSTPLSVMWPSELASGEMPEDWEKYANELGDLAFTSNEDAPQTKTIAGQPHELAYITPEEAELLKMHGGAGIDSDDDGIKEYFDFGSWASNAWESVKDWATPTTGPNAGKSFIGADSWDWGGGITTSLPEEQNPEDAKWSGGKEGEGHYHASGWRPDGTPRDSNDDVVAYNPNTTTTTATEPVVNNYDLSGLQGTYGTASNTLGGANIYSFLDNLSSTGGDIASSIGTLSGLTGYDNQADINSLLEQFQGLQTQYGGLEDQYGQAVSSTNQAIDKYEKDLAKYNLDIEGLGIQDIDAVKDLRKKINLSDIEYDFDSGIDQRLLSGLNLGSGYQSDYSKAIGDLDAILGNYETARTNLGTNLGGIGFDNLLTTAEGLGLTGDMAGTQALLDQYKDKASDFGKASGLSSQQVTDYLANSGYTNTAQDIQEAITKAVNARTAEETRISDAEKDALSLANTTLGNVGASNYYSKAILDQLQKAIDTGKGNYADFTSELDFDFSPATNVYTTAQSSLDDLVSGRKKQIDKIEDAITQAYLPFSGLELQEESEFNKIKQALNDSDYDLGYFSGGRVGDLYDTLDTYRGNVDTKLAELDTKREGIEGQAQDVMAQLMDDITTRQTYDKYKGLYDPIGSEIEKYTAARAYDERDAITQELAKRLAQIEQDEQNVSTRLANASADLGNYQFSDYKLVDPLSQMNMGYGLYNEDEEEEDLILPNSAFYQNIIKV